MDGRLIAILRDTEFTFVATVDNGTVRVGIKQLALKQSAHPGFMSSAIAAAAIADDDDFDDAISALFLPAAVELPQITQTSQVFL